MGSLFFFLNPIIVELFFPLVITTGDGAHLAAIVRRRFLWAEGYWGYWVWWGADSWREIHIHGCFLKWWVSPHFTPQVLIYFLVGKPHGFVGETHHFRKPLYVPSHFPFECLDEYFSSLMQVHRCLPIPPDTENGAGIFTNKTGVV